MNSRIWKTGLVGLICLGFLSAGQGLSPAGAAAGGPQHPGQQRRGRCSGRCPRRRYLRDGPRK